MSDSDNLGPDGYTPDSILKERQRRRRQRHVDQMSAPSYWSAFGPGAWVGALIVLVVLVVVFAH